VSASPSPTPEIYTGQFGNFTITAADRREVLTYRAGLVVAALSQAIATGLLFGRGGTEPVLWALTGLYGLFSLGLGVALLTIHIYLVPLHRLLQVFWGIGAAAAITLSLVAQQPLARVVYEQPLSVLGIGFTFAALTGIFFKEAFCFDRLETKLLTPLVPVLLLGWLVGVWPVAIARGLVAAWSVLFVVFALRKCWQEIPSDIGDKSVFAYLARQREQRAVN